VRSHDVDVTRHLVETKFSAVLVSPWATSRIRINSNLGKNVSIIVRRSNTWNLGTEVNNSVEDVRIRSTFIVLEQLAKFSSVTVLNTLNKDISVIEHEVITSHSLALLRQDTFNFVSFTSIIKSDLLINPSSSLLDGGGAPITTLYR